MNKGNRELPKSYKDLKIWKKSFKTSICLLNLTGKLSKTLEIRIILDQLLRSTMSIGANIAEGYGRYNSKEYIRFLRISLGSANEADYWLSLLIAISPNHNKEVSEIISMNIEVVKMLSKSIKTISSK